MKHRLAQISGLFLIFASAAVLATPCPGEAELRHLASRHLLAAAAQQAARSEDPVCRRKGLFLADYLDRTGQGACQVAQQLETETEPQLLALRAAFSWRCGHPREAHASACQALARDDGQTLAWLILGQVLDARFRPRSARQAFEEVLKRSPEQVQALWGLAGLAGSRQERREFLRRFLRAGRRQGARAQRLRSARDNLALSVALGDRKLWEIERLDLPSEIELKTLATSPGKLRGLLMAIGTGTQRRIPALLDSGASGLHLARSAARKAKLVRLAGGRLFGGGGRGVHRVERGLLEKLDLGPLVYRQALGVAAESSLHPRGRYQAIVGLDLFGGLLVTIDPSGQRLRLERAPRTSEADDDPLLVDPWAIPFDGVPLLRVEGQLLVPLRIETERRREEVLALIDTGAYKTLLAESLVRGWAGFRHESGGIRAYGGRLNRAGTLHRAELQLGQMQAKVNKLPVIDLSRRAALAGIRVAAFLGIDFLQQGCLQIDLKNGSVVATKRPAHRRHSPHSTRTTHGVRRDVSKQLRRPQQGEVLRRRAAGSHRAGARSARGSLPRCRAVRGHGWAP